MQYPPVRAVHLTGSIAPEAGGPAYSIPRLCESLREAGAAVDLLTISTPEGDRRTTPHRSFPLGLLPAKLGHAPGMWRWLKENAAAGRIDITHSHNLWAMPSIFPDWLAHKHGIPHVVSPRGTLTEYSMSIGSSFKRLHWPLVQRPALLRAACFHATATSEIDDIRRLGFRQPIALLPIGVDLPDARPPAPRENKTVLYLGRLHPEKGVANLIDAWPDVERQRPDWNLRIVGPDTVGYRRELERQVERLNLKRVAFGKARFGEAKFEEYRAASLYVLPSPTENFGVSVAEALACETPAIANHGAPWKGLLDEDCGWWIPNGARALTDTLLSATSLDSDRRTAMGRNGRAYVSGAFGWQGIAESMLQVYEWLLGRAAMPDCVYLHE